MADRLTQEDKDWIMALPEGEREVVMALLLAFPTATFVDRLPRPLEEQLSFDRNPYRKAEAMPTEIASAEEVLAESDPRKPLKPGGPGHRVLLTFVDGEAMTAYEASRRACGDYHGMRREVRRLYERGYVELLDYTLPNPSPRGRPAVEAWRITAAGRDWLAGQEPL